MEEAGTLSDEAERAMEVEEDPGRLPEVAGRSLRAR